jgi:hypothetical protein
MNPRHWHPSAGRRPGPPNIDPARAPGGVVLHLYAIPTARLLVARHLVGELMERPEDVNRLSALDIAEAERMWNPDEHGLALVVYDGDTGNRLMIETE